MGSVERCVAEGVCDGLQEWLKIGSIRRNFSLLSGTEAAHLSSSSNPKEQQDSGDGRSDCECRSGH